jgi:hypothetical protein
VLKPVQMSTMLLSIQSRCACLLSPACSHSMRGGAGCVCRRHEPTSTARHSRRPPPLPSMSPPQVPTATALHIISTAVSIPAPCRKPDTRLLLQAVAGEEAQQELSDELGNVKGQGTHKRKLGVYDHALTLRPPGSGSSSSPGAVSGHSGRGLDTRESKALLRRGYAPRTAPAPASVPLCPPLHKHNAKPASAGA